MQFDSWAAALAMDGHGGYVWSVYVVALFIVVGCLLMPTLRHRRLLKMQRSLLKIQQANSGEGSHASGT